MARITKNKEERKQELIDAAGRLFLKQGYDKTAVSDIVRAINVAQGTFYYHFKSKEDILVAYVEKDILSLANEFSHIAGRNDYDAPKKINEIFNAMIRFHNAFNELSDFIHHESNRLLHEKTGRMTLEKLVPVLSGIIAAGVSEKRIEAEHPTEVAELLAFAASYYMHLNKIKEVTPGRIKRARETVERSFSKILGVKDYSFKLVQNNQ